jgi:hypothetical protein
MDYLIEHLEACDWEQVRAIYPEGITTRNPASKLTLPIVRDGIPSTFASGGSWLPPAARC